MDDYIAKPIKEEELTRSLEHWLGRGGEGKDRAILAPEAASPEPSSDAPLSQAEEPSDTSASEAVIFDRDGFLERIMEDMELARTVVDCFLGDMPSQISRLRTAIATGNSRLAGEQAHRIKGASSNVGGVALQGVASSMELAGKAGNLEALGSLLPQLEKQFEALKESLGKGL